MHKHIGQLYRITSPIYAQPYAIYAQNYLLFIHLYICSLKKCFHVFFLF